MPYTGTLELAGITLLMGALFWLRSDAIATAWNWMSAGSAMVLAAVVLALAPAPAGEVEEATQQALHTGCREAWRHLHVDDKSNVSATSIELARALRATERCGHHNAGSSITER